MFLAGCEGCGSSTLVGDAKDEDRVIEDLNIDEFISDEQLHEEMEELIPDFTADDMFIEEQLADPIEEPIVLTWAKTYGGAGDDKAHSIQQTPEGGYIMAGETKSFGAGRSDFWVLRLDASGEIIWQKTYGGEHNDFAFSIKNTLDGGYVVAGWTYSFSAVSCDFWVLKLDSNGDVIWQKTCGGVSIDWAFSVRQISDGGYILAGTTQSFGSGGNDIWIIKMDTSGNTVWQKTYGTEYAMYSETRSYKISIQETLNSGYIVAGGDDEARYRSGDFWVFNLDAGGNIVWQKIYGGRGTDYAHSIEQTRDGGYIVAGYNSSFGAGWSDFWVLKLDANGNVEWQRAYGGGGIDEAFSVQQTLDGGYIVAGYISIPWSLDDLLILKINERGGIVWQKIYDATVPGIVNGELAIQQTFDSGYVIAGYTSSFGAGGYDAWVLKLDENGCVSDTCPEDMIEDSSAILTDTPAVPIDTYISPAESHAVVVDTNINPSDSEAIVETQCIR